MVALKPALFGLIAAMAMAPVCALAAAAAPQVTLDTGAVQGVDSGSVSAFLGIPYAAPPVGPLRWRAPQPAALWTGVRKADRFGDACPQVKVIKAAWAQVGPTSEDCLFLNVWRPDSAGAKPLPVMVFIHGGAFTLGAAGVPLYDGANLSRRGAVIVTLNYRLGRLGFFAHPALTAEDPNGLLGNYALMDQIAALRWVQRNVARFGGDPRNVTLFGESAGAGSVQVLMASPLAEGLFAKAISESGAGLAHVPPIRGAAISGEAEGLAWTQSLGLQNVTAQSLRAIPLDQIITLSGRGFPMVDGRVVVDPPGLGFILRKERPIPLIIGSNSFEASLKQYSTAATKATLGDAYPGLLAEYERSGLSPELAQAKLDGEVNAVEPSRYLGDLHATHGAASYVYYFDRLPFSDRGKTPGAPHGQEVEYVFGNQPAGESWDVGDRQVSKLMGDEWVAFAATGRPSALGAAAWTPITSDAKAYLDVQDGARMVEPSALSLETQRLTVQGATRGWNLQAQ